MSGSFRKLWCASITSILFVLVGLCSNAETLSRDDIVNALSSFDESASFDIQFEARKSQRFRDAIMEDINSASRAADLSPIVADLKSLSRSADLGYLYDSLANVATTALKFANLEIVDKHHIKAQILKFVSDAAELATTVEKSSVIILSVPASQRDEAVEKLESASRELAKHYLEATIFAVREAEISYFSSSEINEAEKSADEVAKVDPLAKIAQEQYVEVSKAAGYAAAFGASQMSYGFANAIYTLQVAYENRAFQALQRAFGTSN